MLTGYPTIRLCGIAGYPTTLPGMAKTRTLDDLRALAARVRQAEQVLADARRERDQGIRDVRSQGRHTVAEIADAADVSPATVKIVIRGL